HPREVLAEGVEGDDALRRALGSLRGPRDAVVGDLLGGLRLPAAVGPPDLGLPVRGGVVGLVGTLDALGEGAEVLVLRPLVVGGAERHPDVDLLDDDGGLLAGGALALALPSAATEPLQSAHAVALGTGGAHLDGAAQGALALGDLAASVECEPGEAGAVALGDVVQLVGGLPELVADSGQQAGGLRREVLLHLGLEAVGGLAVGEVGERVLLLPVASRAGGRAECVAHPSPPPFRERERVPRAAADVFLAAVFLAAFFAGAAFLVGAFFAGAFLAAFLAGADFFARAGARSSRSGSSSPSSSSAGSSSRVSSLSSASSASSRSSPDSSRSSRASSSSSRSVAPPPASWSRICAVRPCSRSARESSCRSIIAPEAALPTPRRSPRSWSPISLNCGLFRSCWDTSSPTIFGL